MNMRILAAVLSLSSLAAAGCASGDSGEPPATPASVVAVSPNPVPAAPVAFALAAAPAFEVRDAGGDPIAGVAVSVAVTSGGGSLAGAPSTSAEGPTSIGTWTLGATSGPQTVTVTVAGIAPLVFSVDATPGAPAAVLIHEGAVQVGAPGAVIAGTIRARVRDGFGNGVAGVTVAWTVDEGGGSLAAASSVTNAQGIATAPAWTLGMAGGDEQALIAAFGSSTVRFVVVESQFFVDVRYVGGEPAPAIKQAFTNAARRIASVITGDIGDVPLSNFTPANFCVPTGQTPAITETVDDVLIYASVQPDDGVGGVLGSAGPCNIRTSGGLTVVGSMRFDSEDLDGMASDGRLESVILHEMLHVIGVGTLWQSLGLQEGVGGSTTRFTGPLAQEACVTENGGAVPCASAVPAENCEDLPIGQTCGGGTKDSHWKESIFRSELMTGFVGSGDSPLSAMTVQSLADMGYTVNVGRAESYQVPPPALQALLRAPSDLMRLPEPFLPREAIDPMGRRMPLPPRR